MKKKEKYEMMLPQLKALTDGVNNNTGALANAAALIHETMGFFWTGFYLVKDNVLHLGPFQGPVACYTIPYGKGASLSTICCGPSATSSVWRRDSLSWNSTI